MARITTEEEFISYIKRMLGNPVINVEVADSNVSDCIYDAVQQFQRYNYGEGNIRDAIVLNLSAGVSRYNMSAYNIDSVIDVKLSQGTNGISTLFTPQHHLLYQDWVNGGYPGGGGGGGAAALGGGMVLGNYVVQMTYLAEIEELFTRKYVADFHEASGMMNIRPTPNLDTVGLIFVYRKETAELLYNHPLVKQLAIAKVKKIWGRNLGKTIIQIPGGGTFSGNEIKQEGIDEEKQTLEDMRLESDPLIMFVG